MENIQQDIETKLIRTGNTFTLTTDKQGINLLIDSLLALDVSVRAVIEKLPTRIKADRFEMTSIQNELEGKLGGIDPLHTLLDNNSLDIQGGRKAVFFMRDSRHA